MVDINIQEFGSKSRSGTASRKHADRLDDVINVKDFGATGNGTTDDYAALAAARNAAYANGAAHGGNRKGAILFFPQGNYLISRPLIFDTQGSIVLAGSGRSCTAIIGNFIGYVIDKPNTGNYSCLEGIRDLHIINYLNDPRAGGVRFCATNGGVIQSCYIQGFTGIDCSGNTFCSSIIDCKVEIPWPGDIVPGTVGIYSLQQAIHEVRLTRFDVGIQGYNAGLVLHGCATEVCNTGMLLGRGRNVAFMGSITGKVLTISAISIYGFSADNNGPDISRWASLYGNGVLPGTYIESFGTGTGGTGTYNLNTDHGNLSSRAMSTLASGNMLSGVSVKSFQTERCGTGIDLWSVSGAHFAGGVITGTVGPPNDIIGTPTYSSPWVTVTTNANRLYGLSGTKTIQMAGVISTGTQLNGDRSCEILSANTFRYNPGGDPGTISVEGYATWSFDCQYGLRARHTNSLVVDGTVFSVQAEVAQVDLKYDGNDTGANNTFIGINASWIPPSPTRRSGFKFINCSGAGFSDVLKFNELPGQANSQQVLFAHEGMEYNISDCINATWGAVAAGGGTNHVRVRYNGTAWTVVGK